MSKSARMAQQVTVALLTLATSVFGVLDAPYVQAFEIPTSQMQGCASDANWPTTAKKLDALAAIANCSSTFSQSECRANLGLAAGATAGALATGVAARAALRIKRTPKFCGLRGTAAVDVDDDQSQRPTFVSVLLQNFLAVAQADNCVDPAADRSRKLRYAAEKAAKEVNDQIRMVGGAKLRAEFPALAKNVDEQMKLAQQLLSTPQTRTARESDQMTEMRREIAARLKTLENEAKVLYGREKVVEENGRTRRVTLSNSENPNAARLAAAYEDLRNVHPASGRGGGQTERVAQDLLKRYPMDTQKFRESLKTISVSLTELSTKALPTNRLDEIAVDVARSIDTLAPDADGARLVRLAALREEVADALPTPRNESRMAKEGFKALKAFKGAGGKASFGLVGLVVSGASFASDKDTSTKLGEHLFTETLGVGSLGCATIESQWSTIEGSGDCKPRPRWNGKTTDFALQSEAVQRQELAKHGGMCEVINKVHADLTASTRVTCRANGALLQDDRRQISMSVNFDANGLVQRATAVGESLGESQYDIRYSGDQFEMIRFAERRNSNTARFDDERFRTIDIARDRFVKKRVDMELYQPAEDHFALMQPVIHHAQACCSGMLDGSDPRCGNIQTASRSGGGAPASGGAIRK